MCKLGWLTRPHKVDQPQQQHAISAVVVQLGAHGCRRVALVLLLLQPLVQRTPLAVVAKVADPGQHVLIAPRLRQRRNPANACRIAKLDVRVV